MKKHVFITRTLIVLNVLLLSLNACKEMIESEEMPAQQQGMDAVQDRSGEGSTISSGLTKILEKKGIRLESKADDGSGESGTGCDCEIKVNSISGQVSEWNLTQSLLCNNNVTPIFSSGYEVCCNPCQQDQIGVWKPFNCQHPRGVLNNVYFQSWYFGEDNCQQVLNYALNGAPCSKPYFNYSATATVTVRCKTSVPPPDVPVGPGFTGPYYAYSTFKITSNEGPNPCETFGTIGNKKLVLNKNCWPAVK